MREARTIYLSAPDEKSLTGKVKDFGFGFEDGIVGLNNDHIDKELLVKECEVLSSKMGNDFTLLYKNNEDESKSISFRVRKSFTSKGFLYVLREIQKVVPTLNSKFLNLPDYYKQIMSSPFLLKGGLVVICGSTGNGKSTTATASLAQRLVDFGGLAITIEDPPEYQMTGKIGKGYCIQMPVCEENGGSFATAIKASLRMYPSSQNSTIMMIGEIRDGETAAQLLRDSINGHLIFTTVHANDVITGISRIISLASMEIGAKEACELMSQSLRVIAHQKISLGIPQIRMLVNDGSNTAVSSRIRGNEVYNLNTEIMRQNNLLKIGRLPINEKK